MALIRRVSRLFAADMHAVLDQIEEPEVVLRQAIREMEEELARQRQRREGLCREVSSLSARQDQLTERSRDLDGRLDICFAERNEELAKRITRKKLETLKLGEQAQARCGALNEQLQELEKVLEANADRLDGMRQKAAVLAVSDAGRAGIGDDEIGRVDDDDVEIAFLREKQARAAS